MDVPDGIQTPEDKTLRETISKVATYIRVNGPSFEEELKKDDRFDFINPDNPYFDYFQYVVNHITEKNLEAQNEPYRFSFSSYDKSLSPRDLEIIKTAAEFCVVNEDLHYLDKMRQKFGSNPRFGFLNADHSLNKTFIQFVNQYKQLKTNTPIPPAFDYVKEDYKSTILRRSFERAEYREYTNELENEKEQVSRFQKIQFAALDWTNFKVVRRMELSDTDNEPLEFEELSRKKIDTSPEISLFGGKEASSSSEVTKNRKRKVKAAGETRIKRKKDNENNVAVGIKEIQCPITHKMIPEDKFDRHLQILLGDPHYKMEREKYKAKHRLTNLSSDEVFENIKKIAKNTTGL